MGADSRYFSAVQDNDLVRVHDRADALGNDQHRGTGLFDHGVECFTQLSIGLVVQSAECIIEDEYIGFLGQCTGNGKTLLLSAGDVGAALCDRIIDLFRTSFYEFAGL